MDPTMHCAWQVLQLVWVGSIVASNPAAAAPGITQHIAWANRLTWGLTSTASEGDVPDPHRWLDKQLTSFDATLPAATSELVTQMRITREPMAKLVVEEDAQNGASKAVADPDARIAAQNAYQKAMNELADEARQRSVLRDLYAPDQLREQMTWFWVNYFNVQASKRDIRAMIGDYEQTLHDRAFGRFRDILEATLRHPAMLRYLDNDQNVAGRINENYARELMELHSMGVGSGYTQTDVQELARILTGVGIELKPDAPHLKSQWQPLYVRSGLFEFNPAHHDFGDKHFLGHTIKGSGFDEVEQALDLIAAAPATARHVTTRLATYLMSAPPPPALIGRLAMTFEQTHGDMVRVVRTLVRSREFAASLGHGFKDPMHYAISAVRLAYGNREVLNAQPLVGWIARLGERLYDHQAPDGYPIDAAAWIGSGQMASRFDVARQVGGGAPALFRTTGAVAAFNEVATLPALQVAIERNQLAVTLAAPTKAALAEIPSPREWNVLFLSSPDFMHR